jgi:hypothetical protein
MGTCQPSWNPIFTHGYPTRSHSYHQSFRAMHLFIPMMPMKPEWIASQHNTPRTKRHTMLTPQYSMYNLHNSFSQSKPNTTSNSTIQLLDFCTRYPKRPTRTSTNCIWHCHTQRHRSQSQKPVGNLESGQCHPRHMGSHHVCESIRNQCRSTTQRGCHHVAHT